MLEKESKSTTSVEPVEVMIFGMLGLYVVDGGPCPLAQAVPTVQFFKFKLLQSLSPVSYNSILARHLCRTAELCR